MILASKPIAVMMLGVLIGKKSYSLRKYLLVLLIVAGVALFSFKDKYESHDGEDPILGSLLIAFSLLMDGIFGALQDRMRSVSIIPSSLNLMFFNNAWCSLYLVTLLIITGEGISFLQFCTRHPQIILSLSIVVVIGSLAQFFISKMISNFGSLPLSLVMTIRKFLNVLFSVIIYKNLLTFRQWIAIVIIFSALIFDAVFHKKSSGSMQTSTFDFPSEKDDLKKTSLENIFLNSTDEKRDFEAEKFEFVDEKKSIQ
jgi:UDP-galactose transporter B1